MVSCLAQDWMQLNNYLEVVYGREMDPNTTVNPKDKEKVLEFERNAPESLQFLAQLWLQRMDRSLRNEEGNTLTILSVVYGLIKIMIRNSNLQCCISYLRERALQQGIGKGTSKQEGQRQNTPSSQYGGHPCQSDSPPDLVSIK